MRTRFSAELMSRGPSPLLPGTWVAALEELGARALDYRHGLHDRFAEPRTRAQTLRRLPIILLLVASGIGLAFMVRIWLADWVERRLANNPSRRSAALLVALRNLNRLVVPAVGAGLFFAAFDRAGLFARADAGRFFALPPFVLVLIATGWIAGSLLAPKHRAFRPMPLDDDAARAGYRLVLYLGVVLSLAFLVAALTIRWSFTLATQSALLFPLVILGALGLWRVADRIAEARDHIAEGTELGDLDHRRAPAPGNGPGAPGGRRGRAAARRGRVHAGGGLPRLPQHPDDRPARRRLRDLRPPEQDRPVGADQPDGVARRTTAG